MPFQLYPQLPAGYSNPGQKKDDIFKALIDQRAPQMTGEQRLRRAEGLCGAWRAEGLELKSPPTGMNDGGGGMMGSSFDAQRLILLARDQGREHQMIEEIYSANHEKDLALSDWAVLSRCAKAAGVRDAEKILHSDWGMAETIAKIEQYKAMGIDAVPVVMLQSPVQALISNGAPEQDFLIDVFGHLIAHGTLPWEPGSSPQAPPRLPLAPDSLIGSRVRLNGLQARPELNGQLGVCERLDPETGRVGVRLVESGQLLALKLSNLLAAEAAHEGDQRHPEKKTTRKEEKRGKAKEQKEQELWREQEQQKEQQAKLRRKEQEDKQRIEWAQHEERARKEKARIQAEKAQASKLRHQREQQLAEAKALIEQLECVMPWVEVPEQLDQCSLEDIRAFFDSDGELLPSNL